MEAFERDNPDEPPGWNDLLHNPNWIEGHTLLKCLILCPEELSDLLQWTMREAVRIEGTVAFKAACEVEKFCTDKWTFSGTKIKRLPRPKHVQACDLSIPSGHYKTTEAVLTQRARNSKRIP
jgi:hypothetical protein